MMKYQKSMMKIMESLFISKEEKSIEKIIMETKSGRNSSFSAISWLEENGFVNVKKVGNQRLVSLRIDNYTLQSKYYFDSVTFKALDPFIKLVIKVFSINLSKKIKFIVFFGSALKRKNFSDIDVLLLGNEITNNDIKALFPVRDRVERLYGVILNIHKAEVNINNLFKGIVVYQQSYISFINDIEKQYIEYMEWCYEYIKNPGESIAFENSILNLAYCYNYLNNVFPETKLGVLEYFNKKFKVKNLDELKKAGIEIGEKIFK